MKTNWRGGLVVALDNMLSGHDIQKLLTWELGGAMTCANTLVFYKLTSCRNIQPAHNANHACANTQHCRTLQQECELRPLNQADGSARFNFSRTSVLAGIHGRAPSLTPRSSSFLLSLSFHIEVLCRVVSRMHSFFATRTCTHTSHTCTHAQGT